MNWDFWINSTKVLSIVAAGFFGTLGLLTKYRDKNDNITRPGKFALGGIIFTAVLSLTLQLLQTSKESAQQTANAIRSASEARKSEASARETSKRLEDILKTATETSNQQTENLAEAKRLTGKMDDSLRTQGEVLSGNKRILGGVVEGAQRDARNTVGILRTIWDESNRIDPSQITVHIDYTFLRETVTRPPLLFAGEGEESLSLVIAPTDPQVGLLPNPWSKSHLIGLFKLYAREQKAVQTKQVTVDTTQYQQSSYFSDFRGNLDKFSDMANWNGAAVEVILTKRDPSLLKDLEKALEADLRRTKDWGDFDSYYPESQHSKEADDFRLTPLPIVAKLTVFVRGRHVATSNAVLVRVTEHDEDVSGLIVAKFRIVRVIDDVFPQFKPTL